MNGPFSAAWSVHLAAVYKPVSDSEKRGVGNGGRITTIGFDADDTLWQNETFYRMTQDRFAGLLADYTDRDPLHARLLEAERRNLGPLRVRHQGLHAVDDRNRHRGHRAARARLRHRRDPGRRAGDAGTSHRASARGGGHRAPLAESSHAGPDHQGRPALDQERKLAQSGLGELFDAVEIVSDKRRSSIPAPSRPTATAPQRAMMIGNSMKSDVLPALDAGAWGVFVPHGLTWELEHAEGARGSSAIS
jgi:putative hydrolase of the HAD superfamily